MIAQRVGRHSPDRWRRMRNVVVVLGLIGILAGPVAAESIAEDSQGTLAVNLSNPDDWDNRGLGIQASFLRRFGPLALGGEVDYLRSTSVSTQTERFVLALGIAEISFTNPNPYTLAPYMTVGIGLSDWGCGWDSESNFLWAFGIGAQYGFGGHQASAIFIQVRSLKVIGDEDNRNYPMLLISAGYRFGL